MPEDKTPKTPADRDFDLSGRRFVWEQGDVPYTPPPANTDTPEEDTPNGGRERERDD